MYFIEKQYFINMYFILYMCIIYGQNEYIENWVCNFLRYVIKNTCSHPVSKFIKYFTFTFTHLHTHPYIIVLSSRHKISPVGDTLVNIISILSCKVLQLFLFFQ